MFNEAEPEPGAGPPVQAVSNAAIQRHSRRGRTAAQDSFLQVDGWPP